MSAFIAFRTCSEKVPHCHIFQLHRALARTRGCQTSKTDIEQCTMCTLYHNVSLACDATCATHRIVDAKALLRAALIKSA